MRGASILDEFKLILSACASPLVSLKDVMQWQDSVLLFDTEVIVHGVGRFHLRHHSDDLWHVLPWRERAVVKALRERLQEGNLFVDAGANIGFYSMLASRLVGNSGKVIAVEMMPDTAAILRRHLALNQCPNVTGIEKALSDTAGQMITAKVSEGHYGQASIAGVIQGDAREVPVKTTTLSTILDGMARIALMKMDLEGAELLALQGAASVLAPIDTIFFEQWQGERKVANQLCDAGFVVSAMDGRNQIAIRQS